MNIVASTDNQINADQVRNRQAYYRAAGQICGAAVRWDFDSIVTRLRHMTYHRGMSLSEATGVLERIAHQYPATSLQCFDAEMNYVGTPAERAAEWDQKVRSSKRQPSYDSLDECWIAVGDFQFARLVHAWVRDGVLDAKHAATAAGLAWSQIQPHNALTPSEWSLLIDAASATKATRAA